MFVENNLSVRREACSAGAKMQALSDKMRFSIKKVFRYFCKLAFLRVLPIPLEKQKD